MSDLLCNQTGTDKSVQCTTSAHYITGVYSDPLDCACKCVRLTVVVSEEWMTPRSEWPPGHWFLRKNWLTVGLNDPLSNLFPPRYWQLSRLYSMKKEFNSLTQLQLTTFSGTVALLAVPLTSWQTRVSAVDQSRPLSLSIPRTLKTGGEEKQCDNLKTWDRRKKIQNVALN